MNITDFPAPHIPERLPIQKIINELLKDQDFLKLCFEANSKLSEYIGYLQNLPNPSILVSALTLRESVLSSRIEGTLATIDDVVRDESSSENIKNDIVEIQNYVQAMKFGYETLKECEFQITKHMICTFHSILLTNNVRGSGKTPGQFKTEQNYIRNDFIGNFTPIPPYLTDEYMENLVDYLNNYSEIIPLLQAAIMHVQFEMIHPFKDGNGRVGRLLIPLFLYAKHVIPFPCFYISRYFCALDDNYKKCLANISLAKKDPISAWKEWMIFFLKGVYLESSFHINNSQKIMALSSQMHNSVNRTDQFEIINYLFDYLRIEPKEFLKNSKMPRSSVYNVLKLLTEKGFLTRVGSERKTKYIFSSLIKVLQED